LQNFFGTPRENFDATDNLCSVNKTILQMGTGEHFIIGKASNSEGGGRELSVQITLTETKKYHPWKMKATKYRANQINHFV
jgi:hypothetical protein